MALVCQVCYQSGAIHQRTANRVIVISPMIDARAMGAMGVPPEVGRYARAIHGGMAGPDRDDPGLSTAPIES